MFHLIIILCRYLFVIYIGYFLFEGVSYILDERGIRPASPWLSVAKQRVAIVFMHLTAFLILAYVPNTYAFNRQILILGGLGLLFILCGHVAVDKMYKHSCPLMWNGMFFLMDTGFIMLVRLNPALGERQLLWFLIGFIAMLLIPLFFRFIPKFERLMPVYVVASFVLLLLPLLLGERQFGALNWVSLYGVSFQPSELVKFLYIFYLASLFRKKLNFQQLLIPSAVSALFVCMLVAQKDLGGALIFFMTYVALLFIATDRLALCLCAILGAGVASYGAFRMFPHIQVRVAAWQDPWADMSGGGYQIVRSLFAMGTYGLFGSGLLRGIPGAIPVVESDFIYAAICEEFGSFFGIGLIGVFMMIFYRGVHIALRCNRRYYSLLAAGFTSMLAFQTFLILGGVVKLIPLTGVTLPFVSYGGTSVVVSTLMLGILQWVFMYNRAGSWDSEQEVPA